MLYVISLEYEISIVIFPPSWTFFILIFLYQNKTSQKEFFLFDYKWMTGGLSLLAMVTLYLNFFNTIQNWGNLNNFFCDFREFFFIYLLREPASWMNYLWPSQCQLPFCVRSLNLSRVGLPTFIVCSAWEKGVPAEMFWKYIANSVGVIENPY